MELYYFDKLGNKHSEIIIGYFEPGHSGEVDVKILSVDQNGKLKLAIESDIH